MAETNEVLGMDGNWRLVADSEGGYPWPQIQLPSGDWMWPDCSWVCSKCGACLGCIRKMIRHQDDDGTWCLLPADYACVNGGRHVAVRDPQETEID